MTRAWLVTLFGAAVAASCNSPDVVPPSQLNLDRPVDISFACFGPLQDQTGTIVQSAQPPRWCNAYSPVLTTDAPSMPPPGLESLTDGPIYSWYGFILQSASGTVALSRFQAKPSQAFVSGASVNPLSDVQVIDGDPGTPGKNAISVGENPIAIGTDVSGCNEVIANAGSCDLSVLDANSAIAADVLKTGEAVISRMAVLKDATTPMRARAAAMVIQPSPTEVEVHDACPVTAVGGPTSAKGLAYIAYPACNLVAGVNLATGVIEQGIQFHGSVPTVLDAAGIAGLSCADECDGGPRPVADPTALRPVTLDLKVDVRGGTRRLAIGADNSAVITVVDLDLMFAPQPAPLQVALEDKDPNRKLGVTTVALTPQIAMGNSTMHARRNNTVNTLGDESPDPPYARPVIPADAIGASPGGEGQYVYAVATDGTVRVVDVLTVQRECDTQVDMRFVRAIKNIKQLQCFPVGDPATPPRRQGARGPGLEFPIDGAATSVAIIHGLDAPLTSQIPRLDANGVQLTDSTGAPLTMAQDNIPTPGMLIGYFAVVSTSSGQSFVVNVDDDEGPDVFDPANPQATAPVLTVAHQVRDGFGSRGETLDPTTVNRCTSPDPIDGATTGGPRSTATPVINVAANTVGADATQASKAFGLPNLVKEACSFTDTTVTPNTTFTGTVSQLQMGASAAARDAVYPDLRATLTENWSLNWEGPLSADTALTFVDGPPVRSAQMRIDSEGIHLIDDSRPFCEAGVEPFDIVQLRGCNPINGDSECPANYSCFVHDSNPVPGLGSCMLTSEASRLSVACHDFLTTARRYTVARAESGELTLFPRKHVLSTTPIDGCTDDAQCTTLAGYALSLRNAAAPFAALKDAAGAPITDPHTWQCALDPQRAPVGGDPAAKRCIATCTTPAGCDVGTICIGPDGMPATEDRPVVGGTCMESVLPPQSCVNGPQRFDLRASEAFTLLGTSTSTTRVAASGYVSTVVEQGGTGTDQHVCVKPVVPGSVTVSRIPLTAPACDPTADPATGAIAGGFEPNPCSTTVDQVDDAPSYLAAGQCVLDQNAPTVPVARTGVPAIKVRTRNATLTLVDPYSPGDAVCVGDRAGNLGKIPLMLPAPFSATNWFDFSYKLTFDQRAGYLPLALSPVLLQPALPVKVVRGPSDSIWVMDDGDVQAVTVTQSSTKGQVFRIEMPALSVVNTLQ